MFSYVKFEKMLKDKDVSAYKISKETGIATATLSAWKKRKYTPKIDKLQKIANYFNVSVEYFLEK
nr:helix-turn-helix transcriptional regulator [Sedimentibacter sp.]